MAVAIPIKNVVVMPYPQLVADADTTRANVHRSFDGSNILHDVVHMSLNKSSLRSRAPFDCLFPLYDTVLFQASELPAGGLVKRTQFVMIQSEATQRWVNATLQCSRTDTMLGMRCRNFITGAACDDEDWWTPDKLLLDAIDLNEIATGMGWQNKVSLVGLVTETHALMQALFVKKDYSYATSWYDDDNRTMVVDWRQLGAQYAGYNGFKFDFSHNTMNVYRLPERLPWEDSTDWFDREKVIAAWYRKHELTDNNSLIALGERVWRSDLAGCMEGLFCKIAQMVWIMALKQQSAMSHLKIPTHQRRGFFKQMFVNGVVGENIGGGRIIFPFSREYGQPLNGEANIFRYSGAPVYWEHQPLNVGLMRLSSKLSPNDEDLVTLRRTLVCYNALELRFLNISTRCWAEPLNKQELRVLTTSQGLRMTKFSMWSLGLTLNLVGFVVALRLQQLTWLMVLRMNIQGVQLLSMDADIIMSFGAIPLIISYHMPYEPDVIVDEQAQQDFYFAEFMVFLSFTWFLRLGIELGIWVLRVTHFGRVMLVLTSRLLYLLRVEIGHKHQTGYTTCYDEDGLDGVRTAKYAQYVPDQKRK
ncbi:TPA: hypothetical protein N0F65_002548 [Lagenidium giganteum]|uniref:Uncharacterized protein n=1 Tax=Lagenidium giganteum TaxID=4803 RepID=A0AAV2YPT5_9STRA|nr:TPA: hypothetical protein N0F65_002548 [Lagenidium giganteum]